MTIQPAIQIGHGVSIAPRNLTRHIGIFGATGTGKTTTAAAIVERLACPVIVLDAKGDLASLGRVVAPWQGAQMRVEDVGSDLLQRVLDLSPAQAGVLEIAIAWAQDHRVPCNDLDDLSGILNRIGKGAAIQEYGLVSAASVAAVQRAILKLRRNAPWAFGVDQLRGWTAGKQVIHAPDLVEQPGLYAAFVTQLLDKIYRGLAEIGDAGAPGLAIMVDEAHLLFSDAPRAVVQRLEQIVRLIRSKSVCLIFVTQSPADLPPTILGQLATRIQHGLRAATVQQQSAVRAAAETMPGDVKPGDILSLGMGEALVSTPDPRGIPVPAVKVNVVAGKPLDRVFSDAPPTASTRPSVMAAEAWPYRPAPMVEINMAHGHTFIAPPSGDSFRNAWAAETLRRAEAVERKRKPWWFWVAAVAAAVYLPMILL